MTAEPDLAVRRPFQWGILILADPTASGVRWPELVRGAAFAATPSCVVTVVRHAQDTDSDPTLAPDDVVPPFEVSVRCWVNRQQTTETSFDGLLELPSGSLQLGDADRWDKITMPSDVWPIQIATFPPDHPEQVDIWLGR